MIDGFSVENRERMQRQYEWWLKKEARIAGLKEALEIADCRRGSEGEYGLGWDGASWHIMELIRARISQLEKDSNV